MKIEKVDTDIHITFENQEELYSFLELEKDIATLIKMKFNAYLNGLFLSLPLLKENEAKGAFEYFKNTYQ